MATATVDEYLQSLVHARIDEVLMLREAIRGLDPNLRESIKWNAPSYGYGVDHRLTMRLQPGDHVDLILHRGAAKRADDFEFGDPSGLVRWLAPDRGVIEVTDSAMLADSLDGIRELASRWFAATRT